MSDFIRQLDQIHNLGSQPALSHRLHIDPILMMILLVFTSVSLFILYSASGQSMDIVIARPPTC